MPDYPDFTQYAYIDIIAQSLGRVLTRPTYGGAQVSTVLDYAAPNVATEFIAIAGEGMIYGGYLAVWAHMIQDRSWWLSNYDGNPQSANMFEILAAFGGNQPHGTTPIMTRYDVINYQYGAMLPYGITFEESAVFFYREARGDTPLVLMEISYALT